MARTFTHLRLVLVPAVVAGLLLAGAFFPDASAAAPTTPVTARATDAPQPDTDGPEADEPAANDTGTPAENDDDAPETEPGKGDAGNADAPDAQAILFKAEPDLLEQVLAAMDIPFEKIDDLVWRLELGDYPALLLSDNVDIQLYAGFAGVHPSLQRINLWNMERRFSRAYLDDDLEPCLEADLDFEGGITVGAIKQFITLFAKSVEQFDAHFR